MAGMTFHDHERIPTELADAIVERSRQNDQVAMYVLQLVTLHRLIVAGNGNGDEADAVRDKMDRSWNALDEVDIALVDRLYYALNE